MSSMKKETSDTSPVLFLNKKGEQMRFFLRPGPTKVQLQPLIADGGGVLCRTQEPSAVLLADPGEIGAVAEAASQFYVSTQYIRDCVIQNQQLDMESYRLSNLQPIQTRMASRKQKGVGRMGYSMEDDSAILKFMSRRKHDAKGNRVWKDMERQGVTGHSWQSMKDRFLKHLQHKLPGKSPKKDAQASTPKKSCSSDSDVPHPSPKTKRKPVVVLSSDSDSTQISPETGSEDQPDPGSLPKQGSSAGPPDSETDREHPVGNEVVEDPSSEANQELERGERRDERERQQCQQDDRQHEVAAKKARLENDTSGPDASHGHPTAPSAKGRRKSKTPRCSGRQLGILERAAREFEDSQTLDSQEDLSQSQQSSATSETDDARVTVVCETATGEQPAMPDDAQHHDPDDSHPGPSGVVAPIASDPHMFLFQQESQEDLGQLSEHERQSQDSSETKRHVIGLMQESRKDLADVMKALLKASGDVTLALSYLVEGRDPAIHGSLWTKSDDRVLLSADPSGHKMLHEKYGAERVSKRIAFLTVE